jgi:LPS export ABC transporter protein LptC
MTPARKPRCFTRVTVWASACSWKQALPWASSPVAVPWHWFTGVNNLGISLLKDGVHDKAAALEDILKETGVPASATAFVGDDLPDLPIMRRVGVPIAVGDAHDRVKQAAILTTQATGGHGAVREISERILKARVRLGAADQKTVHMKKRRLVQRVLLTIVVLALAGAIALFIGYRRMTRNPQVLVDLLKEEADMQLNKIRQTAMKNGIREWRLEADSATLIEKEKTMLLARPDVEFFMSDGDHMHLTADQGTIYTDSSSIECFREGIGQQQLISTSRLKRSTTTRAARELRADTPVTLSPASRSPCVRTR